MYNIHDMATEIKETCPILFFSFILSQKRSIDWFTTLQLSVTILQLSNSLFTNWYFSSTQHLYNMSIWGIKDKPTIKGLNTFPVRTLFAPLLSSSDKGYHPHELERVVCCSNMHFTWKLHKHLSNKTEYNKLNIAMRNMQICSSHSFLLWHALFCWRIVCYRRGQMTLPLNKVRFGRCDHSMISDQRDDTL